MPDEEEHNRFGIAGAQEVELLRLPHALEGEEDEEDGGANGGENDEDRRQLWTDVAAPNALPLVGKSRLFCGGLLLVGPDLSCGLLLWVIILGAFTLWLWLIGARLWHYSPFLVVMPSLLLGLSLCCFFLTACVDPGILPKRGPPDDVSCEAASRWCNICNIDQPVDTYHCHDCNNCVLKLDHHCGVLGTW